MGTCEHGVNMFGFTCSICKKKYKNQRGERMSDIMLGVLKMTDDMFWSDDIITRHQHNQIRLEAAGVIESQKSIIAELEQQTKILQGNWDRCFNSRAEFIREKAELEQKLAQEREANRWIPVTESLPKEKGLYLINFYDGVNTWFECCELCFTHSLVFFNNKLIKDGATHWMKTTEVK